MPLSTPTSTASSRRASSRHRALAIIIRPLFATADQVPSRPHGRLVSALWVLTSFGVFAALTPPDLPLAEIARAILRLIDGAAIDVRPEEP